MFNHQFKAPLAEEISERDNESLYALLMEEGLSSAMAEVDTTLMR